MKKDSNRHPQHMLLWRNKQNYTLITLLIRSAVNSSGLYAFALYPRFMLLLCYTESNYVMALLL